MKMMKLALLGGAALAVSAAAAQADDLGALKAEIEALNARVAQLEATPSVPSGFMLMTVNTGDAYAVPGLGSSDRDRVNNKTATVISVLPTADAPATTSIEWSGYERDGIVYGNDGSRSLATSTDSGATFTPGVGTSSSHSLDVPARAQIKVVGKTDTAVGEVGALVKIRGDLNGEGTRYAYIKEAWGWWAMTPELTLGSGYSGSLGNIGYGYDGACNCYYTDNADVAMNPGDTSQMRLTFASGPMTMALAIEDASGYGSSFDGVRSSKAIGVAGEFKYTGDSFNGEVSGYWRNSNYNIYNYQTATWGNSSDPYGVGAGVGFALGDMASLSMGTQVGRYNNGQKFWVASILGSVNLSDVSHLEVAYGHRNKDYNGASVDGILAGIYYDPVKQLTVGIEGEWWKNGSYSYWTGPTNITKIGSQSHQVVDLVTVFRF